VDEPVADAIEYLRAQNRVCVRVPGFSSSWF
jgi:hypothetical protein